LGSKGHMLYDVRDRGWFPMTSRNPDFLIGTDYILTVSHATFRNDKIVWKNIKTANIIQKNLQFNILNNGNN